MSEDKVVCYCFKVTYGDIKAEMEKGATTLEQIQDATGAGTACGRCNDAIEEILKSSN